MLVSEAIPFDPTAQRRTERHWLAALRHQSAPDRIRRVVQASWNRCFQARVRPDMPEAPLSLDDTSLASSRELADWLPIADGVVGRREGAFGGPGHILTLFDASGRMLSGLGDPHALEGLAEINFRPGGLWQEGAVGTNGPGTALATGQPVHIVGAEHFCQAWQRWHCAAVPLRDPATGDVLGVLDISGFREYAHPHSLDLAKALVVAIEQMLVAREAERRSLALGKLADLAMRYPGDPSVALDRGGRVLRASANFPATLTGGTGGLRGWISGWTESVRDPRGTEPCEVTLQDAGRLRRATWHPVLDGRTLVGGCLVLEAPAPGPRGGRALAASRPASPTAYTFADVLGDSPRLREALHLAHTAAATALPVLLLGESGTGKEVFAQAIHAASARAHRPFVAVNCAALPRELIESELFGYVAGAYTGARKEGGIGKFEAAEGGTIFLDEIAELSPAAQAALLRVLQEGEVTRVGGNRARKVDVRVMAATNRDLPESLARGRLRSDLFHRLDVLRIQLSPLRERRSDVRPLARRFLAEAAAELDRPDAELSNAVLATFERLPWPGNVRELRNIIRRLVAVAEGFPVIVTDLPATLNSTEGMDQEAGGAAGAAGSDAIGDLVAVVASARTMGEAARRLGITRSTLYRRMERHGLRPHRVLREH
jgi:transcriptional regulator of acetoin/glycerol metabolism